MACPTFTLTSQFKIWDYLRSWPCPSSHFSYMPRRWWYYASCSPSDPPLVQHYAVLYLLSSAHCLIWPALSLPWGPWIHHQQRSEWQFVLMPHIHVTPSNCKGYPTKSNQCLRYLSQWHYQNWASNMFICKTDPKIKLILSYLRSHTWNINQHT